MQRNAERAENFSVEMSKVAFIETAENFSAKTLEKTLFYLNKFILKVIFC